MPMAGLDPTQAWYRVADRGIPAEGGRIHVRVAERFVTVFRHRGKLSCLDSVCYHASGPMTEGKVEDIEDLGVSVVSCPWHRFMVTLDGGIRAYQAVVFVSGKPVNAGWTLGKVVQRPHLVVEQASGLYVALQLDGETVGSDKDACNPLCTREFSIHTAVDVPSQSAALA